MAKDARSIWFAKNEILMNNACTSHLSWRERWPWVWQTPPSPLWASCICGPAAGWTRRGRAGPSAASAPRPWCSPRRIPARPRRAESGTRCSGWGSPSRRSAADSSGLPETRWKILEGQGTNTFWATKVLSRTQPLPFGVAANCRHKSIEPLQYIWTPVMRIMRYSPRNSLKCQIYNSNEHNVIQKFSIIFILYRSRSPPQQNYFSSSLYEILWKAVDYFFFLLANKQQPGERASLHQGRIINFKISVKIHAFFAEEFRTSLTLMQYF